MSIFESLLRFIDIIEFRNKQEERRVKRKEQPPGDDDDVDIEVPPSRPESVGAPLRCRVCGYSGGPEHRFCPRCLAETMERQP
jgi:rubrerythrin